MIGTTAEVTYVDGRPADRVTITHYAVGRVARWARLNGLPGLDPMADGLSVSDRVLLLQVMCWAELTRGQSKPQEFDAWCAGVKDFDPVADEVVPADPTPPAP
jgi:hypothetical protein